MGCDIFDANNFHATQFVSDCFSQEIREAAIEACVNELLDFAVVCFGESYCGLKAFGIREFLFLHQHTKVPSGTKENKSFEEKSNYMPKRFTLFA